MTPPESETHDLGFVQRDNGELEEDVVAKEQAGPDRSATDPEIDQAITASFPASDPPSSWSGGDADDRVVDRAPLKDVPERRHPEQPVPGTLPRPRGPGTDEDRD